MDRDTVYISMYVCILLVNNEETNSVLSLGVRNKPTLSEHQFVSLFSVLVRLSDTFNNKVRLFPEIVQFDILYM